MKTITNDGWQKDPNCLPGFCAPQRQVCAVYSIRLKLDGISDCETAVSHHEHEGFEPFVVASVHDAMKFVLGECDYTGGTDLGRLQVSGRIRGNPVGFMSVPE